MAYELILLEKDADDKFAVLTLNRPEKLNALSKALVREIVHAVRACVADPDVNALVINGAGRGFSSGYDLQGGEFVPDVELWREDMSENAEAWLEIWRAPIPVIASVHGFALAGALELMMCCDLAIAAEDAKFGEPEVRHASGPPTLMMPWLISSRDARWLMYTGDVVSGEEAMRMRLVNKIVPADCLKEETFKLARKLARMPLPGIKFAKASLNQQQVIAGLLASFSHNIEAMAALHTSKGGAEWLNKTSKMTLKEFLTLREAPFKDLD